MYINITVFRQKSFCRLSRRQNIHPIMNPSPSSSQTFRWSNWSSIIQTLMAAHQKFIHIPVKVRKDLKKNPTHLFIYSCFLIKRVFPPSVSHRRSGQIISGSRGDSTAPTTDVRMRDADKASSFKQCAKKKKKNNPQSSCVPRLNCHTRRCKVAKLNERRWQRFQRETTKGTWWELGNSAAMIF